MDKVLDLENKLRSFLHDSTIAKTRVLQGKNNGFWDQLWTSLDTIDDTQSATRSFRELDNKDFQKQPYISTYGLLQALYLQQDAVSNLKESIVGIGVRWKTEYPALYLVRTIRNESTGHPTKNTYNQSKINLYAVIDRNSMSMDGFSYMMWVRGKPVRKQVKFIDLINTQEAVISVELARILKILQKSEEVHIQSFKNESLAKLLPEGEPYFFSLLRQVASDEFAWQIFINYKEAYEQIKIKIEARYGPLKNTISIPGTELLVNELDRVFLRIEELKKKDNDVEIDIGIYADALVEKLKELKGHLKEIDEKFGSND